MVAGAAAAADARLLVCVWIGAEDAVWRRPGSLDLHVVLPVRDVALAGDQRSRGASSERDSGTPEFRQETGVSGGDIAGESGVLRLGIEQLGVGGLFVLPDGDAGADPDSSFVAAGGIGAAGTLHFGRLLGVGGFGAFCPGSGAGEWLPVDAGVLSDADLLPDGEVAGGGNRDFTEEPGLQAGGGVPAAVCFRRSAGLAGAGAVDGDEPGDVLSRVWSVPEIAAELSGRTVRCRNMV